MKGNDREKEGERINGWMDSWIAGWMHGCMDAWVDGWTDGWMSLSCGPMVIYLLLDGKFRT